MSKLFHKLPERVQIAVVVALFLSVPAALVASHFVGGRSGGVTESFYRGAD